jgi:hypothetical protein
MAWSVRQSLAALKPMNCMSKARQLLLSIHVAINRLFAETKID